MARKLVALISRHGETVLNKDNRFRSRLDPPLNSTGIKEAEKVGTLVCKRYDVREVVSSPMLRALQTADIIAESCHAKVKQDRGLISWNLGVISGNDKDEWDDILQMYVDNPKLCPPEGESLDDLEARTDEFFREELKKDPQEEATGTAIGGYAEQGPYHCGECVHRPNKTSSLCNHPKIVGDPALASKKRDGLVQIDKEKGCCEYVRPKREDVGITCYVTHTSNIIALENLFHGNHEGRPESNEDSVAPGGLAEIWVEDGEYDLVPVIGEQKAAFGE